jgi:hypothetical protein
MKIVDISNLGRDTIIRHLAQHGKLDEPEDFGVEPPTDAELEDGLAEPFVPTGEMYLREAERQASIAAGIEAVCACCGCSDSRSCPGGCIWATTTLCSRCV